jgi:hypothetical protein
MSTNNTYQNTYNEVEEIDNIIDTRLAQVNTIVPCSVVSTSTPKVTVKPLIKRVFIDNNDETVYIDYEEVPNIPVLNFGNSMVNINFPEPQVGDTGVLLVNQKYVGDTYASGEIQSARTFSLLDGVFLPFYSSSTIPATGTLALKGETKVEVSTEDMEVMTTRFAVKNAGGQEVLTTLVTALTAIMNGIIDPPNTFNAASIAAIQAQITILQTFL